MKRAVIVLGILALAPSLYGQTPDYQPPGRTVDVGGRRMHIHCSGSSNSLHIVAAGSGHEIHLFQPTHVIEGITRAVSAVRTGAPLSGQ